MFELPIMIDRVFHLLKSVLNFFVDEHLHQNSSNQSAKCHSRSWNILKMRLRNSVLENCSAKNHLEDPYCENFFQYAMQGVMEFVF